jgi:hypothetical protein
MQETYEQFLQRVTGITSANKHTVLEFITPEAEKPWQANLTHPLVGSWTLQAIECLGCEQGCVDCLPEEEEEL